VSLTIAMRVMVMILVGMFVMPGFLRKLAMPQFGTQFAPVLLPILDADD
jgi:hypothetical protein